MIEALVQAFETLNDWSYIKLANNLLVKALRDFYDESNGVFYLNNLQASHNIGNLLSAMDDSFSSSLSIMVKNLYKLGQYMENNEFLQKGERVLQQLIPSVEKYESVFSELLISCYYYSQMAIEIVITQGKSDNEGQMFKKLNNEILSTYLPIRMIYRWPKKDDRPKWVILEGKLNHKESTVYICKGDMCSLPVFDVESLKKLIMEWI